MSERNSPSADKQSTARGVLARLWWMLFGNVVLAFSLVFIFENRTRSMHTADGVFWITVASLVLIRYLDIRFCDGHTATGNRASTAHWIRYVILLIVCSTAVWILAHAANYLFVTRAPHA